MIQVSGLTKTFREKARGGRPVVDRVSFDVPSFNVSQLIKEIIIGEYSPVNFAAAFASNVLHALVAYWVSVRIFKTETVLFRS